MCGACNVSISQALKAKNKCETYQFRWLKNKRVCCVPSCGSTDVEVHVHRHDFSWEDVCNSIGKASVSSPVDRLLCSKHYNVVSKACVCVYGVKHRHEHSATLSVNFVTCPDPKRRVESYLRSAVGFSDTIQNGDQVCYLCYKFFNKKLKTSECILSGEDIVLELKAKQVQLERITVGDW